jgi:hypothetical protein
MRLFHHDMDKRRISFSGVLAVMILLAGCASIIKGGEQSVSIGSNPADASVTIHDLRRNRDVFAGRTPATITLKRGAGFFKGGRYRVTVEKPGYTKSEALVEGSVNGWYIGGNLIFGGLIGYLIVDPLTGGMFTLQPEEVDTQLSKLSASVKQDTGLVVVLKDQLPDLPTHIKAQMKPIATTLLTEK